MNANSTLHVVGDAGLPHRDGRGRLGCELDWTVRVTGAVACPSDIPLSRLWAFPAKELEADILCVSRGRIYEPADRPVRFVGVPLSQIISAAQPRPGVRTVRFVSRAAGACGPANEPHDSSLAFDYCCQPDEVFLTGCLDGRPLAYRNGGPLRSVARGRYFYKSVKWLGEVQFLEAPLEECLGTWERYAGYHNIGEKGGERFEPFLKTTDDAGELQAVPKEERRRRFEETLRTGDASRLVAAVLHHKDVVPDFGTLPGWDKGLRFASSDTDERNLPRFRAALRGTYFRGLDLSGWNLAYVNFSLSHFHRANLRSADMHSCDLEGATFRDADLSGANLREAYLGGVEFYGTDRDGRRTHEARVEGLDATGATGLQPDVAECLRSNGATVDATNGTSLSVS